MIIFNVQVAYVSHVALWINAALAFTYCKLHQELSQAPYLQWKKFNTILSGAFQYGLVKLNATLSRIKIIYTIWMDGGVSFC